MLNAYEMFCRRAIGQCDPLRPRRAVFVDRDGTMIEDVGYLRRPEQVKLLPGAADGLRMFQSAGFVIAAVSNQAGLARGYLDEGQFRAVHERFMAVMDEIGVELSACYYCAYYGNGSVSQYRKTSDARKPGPGMLLRAGHSLGVYLRLSWMIGDKWDDVSAGLAAGTRTVKLPGASSRPGRPSDLQPDFFAENLQVSARIITGQAAGCL